MSNLPHYPPHIVPKKGALFTKLSIRVKLIIFLSAVAGISYMFMLYFKNEAKCERLEPNHVICQQYKTSFDLAKSIFGRRLAKDSVINYRLTGTERRGNKLYLKTDAQPILYLYEPAEYNEKIPPAINRVENFIFGQGRSQMTLFLANSRDRQLLLYFAWGFPAFFLFITSLPKNQNN